MIDNLSKVEIQQLEKYGVMVQFSISFANTFPQRFISVKCVNLVNCILYLVV